MATELWETLAEAPVPPPPVRFDQDLQSRINKRLAVVQIADFVLKALPYVVWHFARGVFGLLAFTLSGKFLVERRDRNKDER